MKELPPFVSNPIKTEGHFAVGIKGSGKSALGENIAATHYRHRYIICDLLDGNDFEAAFWGIPGSKGGCYPTLLVHPPWYEVTLKNGMFSHIKPISSEEGLKKILKIAKQERRIVTMACKLWRRGTVGNLLKEWLFDLPDITSRVKSRIFVLMREVGSYAFSQLKIFPELEDEFRRALVYLFRESRHHEISFFFDAHRLVDLHRSIRVLCDRSHIKLSSREMIPNEKQWVFQEIKSWREKFARKAWKTRETLYPRIQKLWAREFYGVGPFEELRPVYKFQMAPFRHKRPSDVFEDITGFHFKYDATKEEEFVRQNEMKKAPKKELIYIAMLQNPGATDGEIARRVDCSRPYVTQIRNAIRTA
ncbi:MAG: hypothetical protein ACE5I5_20390 [Candidatus Heimdallarchaeota archaeon]